MFSEIMRSIIKKQSILNFIQYGLVGVVGTVLHTSMLVLCVEYFKTLPIIATTIGFLLSLIVSYYLNSKWTFKKRKKSTYSFLKYGLTCSIGLLINVAIMFIVVDLLDHWYMLGQIISIIVVPLFNYYITKKWAFDS